MASFNDDDDEEEQEVGDAPESPAAPQSDTAALYSMLASRLKAQPQSQAILSQGRADVQDTMAKNALYAALAQSAGQIGTIGGKAASAAPVQAMAQAGDQNAMFGQQGLEQQAARGDADRDMLYKQLQQKSALEFQAKRLQQQKDIAEEKLSETTRHNQANENLGGQKIVINADKAGGADAKAERDFALKQKTALASDKQLKDANGTLDAIDDANPLVDDAVKNPGSANALGPVLARILSHGQRINMPEIQSQEGGSKAFFDRINTIATRAESGTITPDQAAYLHQTLSLMQNGAASVKSKREASAIKSYTALSPTGVDEPTARTYLGLDEAPAQQAAAAPAAPSAAPSTATASTSSSLPIGATRTGKDGNIYQKVQGGWKRVEQNASAE